MVIAYHLIITAYGWWLPNDLRGSMSREIRCDFINELGDLHFGRKRVLPNSRSIREFYHRASNVLLHPLLEFDNEDRQLIAKSFAEAIVRERYTCYAFAMMRDHTHLCIRKHKHSAEQMILTLQEFSRRAMIAAGRRTFDHPVWGGPGWKVFLDEPEDIWRTIRYVENNPIKAGESTQTYSFVSKYDNWPFHKQQPQNRKR
ncbi:MAG TPA: hypothetical protein VHD56_10660 [Tepidisphaeraceae bacterium]|nr:hypothetical protein [Tepidisphaeraceae bacterium]